MIVRKSEIASKIDKIKSIVPKKENNEALNGILVKDGCLIAANTEIRIKARLDILSGQNESFIIPERAFDLIKNLPEGDMEITTNSQNAVTIKMEKIKNSYNSFSPDEYMYGNNAVLRGEDVQEVIVNSHSLKNMISHVLYAVAKQNADPKMRSMYMEAHEGQLNVIGTDGHVMAWDWDQTDGNFKLLIPRTAVEKLMSLELEGEVHISFDKFAAIFSFDDYEIYTRIVEGDFFKYRSIFGEAKGRVKVNRTEMLRAITRAKLCTDENVPVKMVFGDTINLTINDRKTDYTEDIELIEHLPEPLTIGFDSRLVQESLKALDYETLDIGVTSARMPMVISAEGSNAKALVLPVNIRG